MLVLTPQLDCSLCLMYASSDHLPPRAGRRKYRPGSSRSVLDLWVSWAGVVTPQNFREADVVRQLV